MKHDRPQDYAIPFHRAIISRELIAGISRTALFILFILTVIIVLGLHQWWFIAVTILLFLVFRKCTKYDEYLIEIIMHAVLLPDELLP